MFRYKDQLISISTLFKSSNSWALRATNYETEIPLLELLINIGSRSGGSLAEEGSRAAVDKEREDSVALLFRSSDSWLIKIGREMEAQIM